MNITVDEIKETIENLKGGREILEPEGAFTKNYYARTKDDKAIEPVAVNACKFCTLGALAKAVGDIAKAEDSLAIEYLANAFDVRNGRVIPHKNDAKGTKQLHVLMAYDFAILMAKDDLKKIKRATKVAVA